MSDKHFKPDLTSDCSDEGGSWKRATPIQRLKMLSKRDWMVIFKEAATIVKRREKGE